MRHFIPLIVCVMLLFSSLIGIQSQRAAFAQSNGALPPEFDRVLRDYETAWREHNAQALASLFHKEGFVLSPGGPPVQGRKAIEQKYQGAGGPLHLRVLKWEREGSIGFMIGEFSPSPDFAKPGKFTLTLKQGVEGKWFIMSDMDNSSQPTPRPSASPGRNDAEEADRKHVLAVGFTEEEADCWKFAAKTAGKFFALPELHPMDKQEIASAIHIVQNKLLSRPTYRAYLEKAKASAPSNN